MSGLAPVVETAVTALVPGAGAAIAAGVDAVATVAENALDGAPVAPPAPAPVAAAPTPVPPAASPPAAPPAAAAPLSAADVIAALMATLQGLQSKL